MGPWILRFECERDPPSKLIPNSQIIIASGRAQMPEVDPATDWLNCEWHFGEGKMLDDIFGEEVGGGFAAIVDMLDGDCEAADVVVDDDIDGVEPADDELGADDAPLDGVSVEESDNTGLEFFAARVGYLQTICDWGADCDDPTRMCSGLRLGGLDAHLDRWGNLRVGVVHIGRVSTVGGARMKIECQTHRRDLHKCALFLDWLGSSADSMVLEAEAVRWLLAGYSGMTHLDHSQLGAKIRAKYTVAGRAARAAAVPAPM